MSSTLPIGDYHFTGGWTTNPVLSTEVHHHHHNELDMQRVESLYNRIIFLLNELASRIDKIDEKVTILERSR